MDDNICETNESKPIHEIIDELSILEFYSKFCIYQDIDAKKLRRQLKKTIKRLNKDKEMDDE